jgi:phosphatidylserine/phosphatidylglycerophosphate/cardiolipin synthase-like enzyme
VTGRRDPDRDHVPRQVPDRVVTSPAERRDAVLDVIRGATREISLSLFRCNDQGVFDELRRARERGVTVTAIVTARADGGSKKLAQLRRELLDTGASVTVYADSVVKYHAKYLVADDGPAIVASLNFTKKCFSRTLDALVVTYDAEVVSGLRALMDADHDMRPAPDSLSPRLIIGPERARAQLTALIRGATSSIRLLDAKLSDPAFVGLLAERRAAGVRVDAFDRKRYGDLKSHGKVCLIDDRIAIVGGLAFAALSLDFRREVAIVVEQAQAIADVRAFLDGVASRSAEAPEASAPA